MNRDIYSCEKLSKSLIGVVRDLMENGKYIRLDYPVMNCYGIDGKMNLMFGGGRDNVRIDRFDNAYVLDGIATMLRQGKYKLVDCIYWNVDKKLFDACSINDIYMLKDVMDKEEGNVLFKLLVPFLYKPEICKYVIEYCWFNFFFSDIHTPVMIWEDRIAIYIKGGIEVCKEIEEFFNENKDDTYFDSMEYYMVEGRTSIKSTPTTIYFNWDKDGKEELSLLKDSYRFPIKIMPYQ